MSSHLPEVPEVPPVETTALIYKFQRRILEPPQMRRNTNHGFEGADQDIPKSLIIYGHIFCD